MSTEFHVTELLPGYALSVMEEDEAAQVEAHLESCPACRAELADYVAVTGELAFAVPDVEPPAALKDQLMSSVRPAAASNLPSSSAAGGWLASLRAFFSGSIWRPVAVVAILALIVSNLFLWRALNEMEEGVVPTFGTITLAANDASGASGVLVISADGEHGSLVVQDLAPLDDAYAYQLWLIENGERDSGGVFSVGEDGYGLLYVKSPRPLADYEAFGVTVEPAEGSPAPTGARVLGSIP